MIAISAPQIGWRAIAPLLALTGGGVITLVAAAVNARVKRQLLAVLSLGSIGLASWFTFAIRHHRTVAMQGALVIDGVSLFGVMILLGIAAISILVAYDYLPSHGLDRPEYYPLLLFCTAGMVLLAAANELILVFLAIEVLSLALYVLAAFNRRDDASQEGALKYFLLGAFSSAFLLYGIAMIYGATASTSISGISKLVTAGDTPQRLVFLALGLIAVGLGFKIAAVPFHMWTPDVYQGAPTPVTGFMAAGTKTAAFVALLRVFLVGFGALQWDWRPVVWVIAVLSMSLGAVVAIVQSDVKRMLAYSSIAHAGYLLVGLVAANQAGTAGSLFYLLVYSLTTLGAFAAVVASGRGGSERLSLSQWQGLGQRNPVFAGVMTLFLLSLAGVPPTAGFMAKFFVFTAAVGAGETALVVAAVLTSVVAAFFYLRLIVLMWMQDPTALDPGIDRTPVLTGALALVATGVLVLGVWPQPLMDLARSSAIFRG